ncbi:MAG: AmmeMemoRadiSam system protein B [Calditrichaeota bacterium]|nr:MAG: AmmeMemoRadiSam system protein B [Calditrichota bacterium]MBL1206790.1 AmmeMemoRadiSam system protein B [Calditrichota bacterium]NOG46618.1 AmmeMemoRadiSam system protein B [Calditrichota bacterium]
MSAIRKAQIAGTFYPENKDDLNTSLEEMLSCHDDLTLENINGIIVPHAGYIYSGNIAAKAYKQIANNKYDNIFVISPSHYDYFEGCSIFAGNYETPIGIIQTNTNLVEALSHFKTIQISNLGHQNEHALEIQLPFLQRLFSDFKLVPIVMGKQSYSTANELAESIFSVLKKSPSENQKNLVVCSSDLSHFYNESTARQLDSIISNDIEEFNISKLNQDILAEKTEACGFGPILAGMMVCKLLGATKSKVLGYGTSADVNKDINRVVGYLSAAFYKN